MFVRACAEGFGIARHLYALMRLRGRVPELKPPVRILSVYNNDLEGYLPALQLVDRDKGYRVQGFVCADKMCYSTTEVMENKKY
eukprot:4671232-Amphidinium_carterae.1